MYKKIKKILIESNQFNKAKYIYFLFAIQISLSIVGAYSMGMITQHTFNSSYQMLQLYFFLFVVGSIGCEFVKYQSNIKVAQLSGMVLLNLKRKTMDSLLEMKESEQKKYSQGDLISRINNDLSRLMISVDLFLRLVYSVGAVAGISVFIIILEYRLFLAFVVFLPLFFVIQRIIVQKSKGKIMPWKEAIGKESKQAQDLLNNQVTIKSFLLLPTAMKWLKSSLEHTAKMGIKGIGFMYNVLIFAMILSLLPIFSVGIFGTYLVSTGEITIGVMTSILLLVSISMKEINGIENCLSNLPSTLSSLERITPIWEEEKEEIGGVETGKNDDFAIDVQQLFFKYSGDDNLVLKNVSFQIKKGERVALVGASGSGKSTLFSLLTGLENPESGTIKVFGEDVQKWNLSKLREKICWITQEVYLFDDTVLSNLQNGKFDLSEDEGLEILSKVKLSEEVTLNQTIGEKGMKLSGGQRQRLAVGRDLLKQAELYLIDEATSALDNETENFVQEEFQKRQETQLIISHRLSTLKNMNRILVLEGGEIVEEGSHKDLLDRNGYYASLYRNEVQE